MFKAFAKASLGQELLRGRAIIQIVHGRLLPQGAFINYDWQGGGRISENSQKNFKSPPILQIKIQTP